MPPLDALALLDTVDQLEKRFEKGQETRELTGELVGRLREFLHQADGEAHHQQLRASHLSECNGTLGERRFTTRDRGLGKVKPFKR